MRLLFLFFALLGLGSTTLAQSDSTAQKYVSIGLYWQGSFIIKHTPAIKHLAVTHPSGGELNIQRQTTGTEYWHQLYRYPRVGLNFVYYDYHHPVLGSSWALSAYLSKPMWETRKQRVSWRIGTGIAYFNQIFDVRDNPENAAMGASLNAVMQTRFEYEWDFTRQASLSFGIGLNHYSSGATSKPNLGINLPSITMGVNYYRAPPAIYSTQPLPELKKSIFYNISGAAGIKQFSRIPGQKHGAYTLSAFAVKPVNHKSNFLLGLEGFYDRSLLEQRSEDTTITGLPDIKRLGITLGHELLFGRLAFQTHFGVYVYRPYKADQPPYYERLGLKYYFTEKLFGSVALKVHRGTADYIEWTAGLRIK